MLRDAGALQPTQPEANVADVDVLLSIARSAGMLVLLDAQIGRQRYQSVAGSVGSLQCFAVALCQLMQQHYATPASDGAMDGRRSHYGD
ncbi:hypothetical protein [Paraburkholderia hospita]|uniref:hypothetical protein n=1 Tax=Paraburkholderia hospita TaxID=169430 RepID=UPI0031015935